MALWLSLLIFSSAASGAGEIYTAQTHTSRSIFQDKAFNFEFLRAIGYTAGGGADINECLDTAFRIRDGDVESWYSEWNKTAARLERAAVEFLSSGHNVSAREAFFRASAYYRCAGFFLDINPDDPRILPTWEKSRDCFMKAASLSNGLIRPVRIPFENTTLPGYLCLVDSSGEERPTLIVHTGFDGTGEELYYAVARSANARGYNVLIFEGPGQGEVIRVQKIHFRHNWESVVTPVVDFALNLTEVDPDKIALMGISFGGYLAPRAAAFEHRIAACIANGGVYDYNASMLQRAPPDIEDILSDENASREFDQWTRELMNQSVEIGWSMGHGMLVFGAASPSEYMRMVAPYTLKDVAPLIKCPTLVVDSDADTMISGQSRPLYDALTCPKEFLLFTTDEGAGLHCQMGAMMISNERIFNWLDGVLQKS
ncbi:MAG: alpha/beta fold hydrolase [Methanothrix sp.]|nr:alpha/beta fold hydrolase [Methanothrix sp.]